MTAERRWVPVGTQVPVATGRRYLMLAVCCMSPFMVGLDNTIVNVGLPCSCSAWSATSRWAKTTATARLSS
ncbi:MAG TPA: hypothetical protein VN969_43830 [Streptosporangiaceae bacterium]|nr:hypothetical protein [Streptosporangiaceae bacterium]